eukprot:169318-Chlamydomonas_euryale.AAC.8
MRRKWDGGARQERWKEGRWKVGGGKVEGGGREGMEGGRWKVEGGKGQRGDGQFDVAARHRAEAQRTRSHQSCVAACVEAHARRQVRGSMCGRKHAQTGKGQHVWTHALAQRTGGGAEW